MPIKQRNKPVIQSSNHKLILSKGTASFQEFELTRPEIIIGRDSSSDVVISSSAGSRRHARLMREGEGYMLEDLASSNGTYLNGERLVERGPLKSGGQIRLGAAITLTYEAPPSRAETVLRSAPPIAYSGLQTVVGEEPQLLANASPPKLIVAIAGGSSQTHILTRPTLPAGRVEDLDIVISSQIVSRQHAHLEQVNGGYKLVVAPEAKNPVLFEGRPLDGSRVLRHGDTFRIGSLDPGMMVTLTYDAPGEVSREVERDIVFGERTLIQVGRDPSNDVVLSSPNVSRFHAQVERVGQRYRVVDLRSSNGTFVNGERVDGAAWLKPDDSIRIGQYRFVMGKDQLAHYDDSNGLDVFVLRLNQWGRKDLNILQDISVAFKPREFIVVVGQSGGGKSPFVDAVAGYRPATPPSKVFVNDIDIYTHFDAIRNDIGFVPQKDIIHMELTVYQALEYFDQYRSERDRRAGKIEFDQIYAILDNSINGKPAEWAQRYREYKAYQKYIQEPLKGKIKADHSPTVLDPGQVARKINRPAGRKVSGLKQFLILSARNVKIL